MRGFVWKLNALAIGAACVLGSLALGSGIARAQTSPQAGPELSPDEPPAHETADVRVIGETPQHEPRMAATRIVAVARSAGFAQLSRIEREQGLYEVHARDERGREVEIWVDPRTEALLLDPQSGKPLSKRIRRVRSARPRLSVEQIEAVVKNAGYPEVYALEYEHALYEVKARDADGRKVELFVHPRTGELLRHRRSGEPLTEDIDD